MTIVAVRSFQNSALPLQNARQLCIVFGRVGGEVCRPIVWISDGGQLEGVVVAQELTVGGRFKGTIHANRESQIRKLRAERAVFVAEISVENDFA
jgi:cytoskeletal protein CcmA (bactofilin family)